MGQLSTLACVFKDQQRELAIGQDLSYGALVYRCGWDHQLFVWRAESTTTSSLIRALDNAMNFAAVSSLLSRFDHWGFIGSCKLDNKLNHNSRAPVF